MLGGAAVITVGFAMMPGETQAVPLALDKVGPVEIDDLDEEAELIQVGWPGRWRRQRRRWYRRRWRRRRRRWRRRRRVCWWRGRRRVCAWRWY
jgi:hypothetical protein